MTLVFDGFVTKDDGFWLIEIPSLNLMTQGRSKEEAYKMAKSVVIDACGFEKLKIELIKTDSNTFTLASDNFEKLIPLLLKKQRQRSRLTVREASLKMGSNSPNAYGVYEQGRAMPTLEKLSELLKAVNPGHQIKLKCA